MQRKFRKMLQVRNCLGVKSLTLVCRSHATYYLHLNADSSATQAAVSVVHQCLSHLGTSVRDAMYESRDCSTYALC